MFEEVETKNFFWSYIELPYIRGQNPKEMWWHFTALSAENVAYTPRNKSLNECGYFPSNGFQWKTYIELTFYDIKSM